METSPHGEVYSESFVAREDTNIEAIVENIRYYSRIFAKLALDRGTDEDIMQAIRDLKVELSYLFLMEVFDDLSSFQWELFCATT